MSAAIVNPYVGLRPFETNESLLFFGRNDQTLELLQRLHQYHFVAVVGSSGCGKSSLLRAGLIPALKAGYLVDDSDQWLIAIMKPGHSPLYNLAEAMLHLTHLQATPQHTTALVQQVKEQGADALLKLLEPAIEGGKHNLFLLVDQFEELFRFVMDNDETEKKDEAIDFVNIMLELAQQNEMPIYVVMTMRSDFIGDCARFYGLPEAMNKSQYLVPRLNRMQLKTVIEGPSKLFGGKLNPSLASLLLNELSKVKDELPLLQHALMRIWNFEMNENKSGELDLEDYQSIGGIDQALSNHADEALQGMNEEELYFTREMFQALTAIDENDRKIRRPVLLSQLKELTGATTQKLLHIIEQFIKDSRCFLIKNNIGESGEMVIDISHESLIRQWNTLNKWVEEEGEYASVYLQLAESYRLHLHKKRDYLSGTELNMTLDWYNKFKPTATWANRYKEGFAETIAYLQQSKKLSDEREKERLDNERREAEREQQEAEQKILDKKRSVKRQMITSCIVVLAIIISLVIYSVQLRQNEKKAQKAQLEARAAELRTKDLLQLVVSGRGEAYSNKEYNAVVEKLRHEQTYPLNRLIEPRAIRIPVKGSPNADFLIWVEVPSFRRNEIKEVVYRWQCSGFNDSFAIGKEASLGFAYGYRGYGYCPIISIEVLQKKGAPINIKFRLGDYLKNNNLL